MSDANTELDAAIGQIEALNRAGRAEEALDAARALVESYPDNPRAQFAYGSVLDALGREAEAVAPYQRALELGLAIVSVDVHRDEWGSNARRGVHQDLLDCHVVVGFGSGGWWNSGLVLGMELDRDLASTARPTVRSTTVSIPHTMLETSSQKVVARTAIRHDLL